MGELTFCKHGFCREESKNNKTPKTLPDTQKYLKGTGRRRDLKKGDERERNTTGMAER